MYLRPSGKGFLIADERGSSDVLGVIILFANYTYQGRFKIIDINYAVISEERLGPDPARRKDSQGC